MGGKLQKKLKEKAEKVDAAVREAVAKGVIKAKEIVKTVEEKIAELSKAKCEDILGEKICSALKSLAEKIKIKAAEVDKAVKEIVAKGVSKIREIVRIIKEKLFPALNDEDFDFEMEIEMNGVKCEDVLPADKCAALREAAKKLKQKIEVIDEEIRAAVGKGIVKAKEIIEHVRQKLIDLAKKAKTVKCEDILGEEKCTALKEAAKKLKAKVEQIDQAVREAIARGAAKGKEIIQHIRQKLIDLAKKNEK